MMRKIVLSSHFKKDAKKLSKPQLEKVKAVLQKIAAGEKLERKFCDHALLGKLTGFRNCHVLPDLVLIRAEVSYPDACVGTGMKPSAISLLERTIPRRLWRGSFIYKLRDDFMEVYAFRITSHANM